MAPGAARARRWRRTPDRPGGPSRHGNLRFLPREGSPRLWPYGSIKGCARLRPIKDRACWLLGNLRTAEVTAGELARAACRPFRFAPLLPRAAVAFHAAAPALSRPSRRPALGLRGSRPPLSQAPA